MFDQTFDDVLEELGGFGRYQKFVYFFLFLPTIFSAMHKLAWVFIGASPDHRCKLPIEEDSTEVKTEIKANFNYIDLGHTHALTI